MTNTSEVIDTDGIQLRCSYTTDPNDRVSGVTFLAENDTTDNFVYIAESTIFSSQPALFSYGVYLFGSANITKFSTSLSEVALTFNNLKCKHERKYKCRLGVHNTLPTDSAPMQLFVQVPPLKPDRVEITKAPTVVLTTTETARVDTSTSSVTESVNTSTSTGTKSVNTSMSSETTKSTAITSQRSNSSTTTSLQILTTSILDNNITTTTNTFYNSTSSTEPSTDSPSVMEGDNITVKCSGNVGKPAGIFTFQKFRKDNIQSTSYDATTTEIERIPGNCSYYRTSYLIFQVTAEDNQAMIRCVVVSFLAGQDMFKDSEQLEVKYNVRIPTVSKHPDKQEYIVGVDISITLTCITDGNPKPVFHWYKSNQDAYISTEENFTITNINTKKSGLYICNVSNTINEKIYTEAAEIEVNIINEADKSTTQSTSISSSSGVDDTTGKASGNLGPVIGGVLGVVGVFLLVIISYCVYIRKKRTSKIPTDKDEPKGFVDPKPKSVAESKTGNYDYIDLEEDANKPQTVNNGLEVEDINKHNEEYLKKQEEEEQKKNESNTPLQPAVYAQVNEATKSRNKQKTETPDRTDKQEEDTNAETQEGIDDKAGDLRHKENENVEHFNSSNNSSKQNSNCETKLSKQTSQIGSYANQAFEKDENRKVATVSPTIRSSGGSQDEEQTNQSRHSQSKKGYENIKGTDQTGTSEEDTSHRTAL
ncbi:unnamed protein product [Mytilus coruscus]|uniref:Ig-like domain-containing protein n=1 Tax=Mytilus coruscus TaxID=42192 RepID=A0A6J8DKX7_MYTCO|nr:unnamed protein product [Mytilus coruscus]